ncbi:MAG: heavy-metal-associated domain-containing protein [Lachnospiraceae bacterium]|nr:heavy-metal-associated domain-containing protein [Lachnospiraceae bacterium]
MNVFLSINPGTAVVLGILIGFVVLAVKSSVKHLKGEGGCCGGGGSCSERPEPKELDGPVICKKIVKISGMHCENCRNSIERAVNKIDGASCRVDLKKGAAEVLLDREVSDEALRFAIERLDFKVQEIKEEPRG